MKKLILSITVFTGAIGICISNSGTTNAQVPAAGHQYMIKDTVPTDTMKPKDSSLIKL